ncbi:MAG: Ppx/GppA phosphatase family protein [Candidatus Nanopelagicales bacterium]
MTGPVAAIDCGTNSIRLLVADRSGDSLVDLDRRMTVVRLGEGVDRTGRLSSAALQRTFAACRNYGEVISDLGADRIRFVATSASRDADNSAEFTAGVEQILGVEPEVISGDEEARLSYVGATRGLAHDEPVVIFDIGGGSTEFVVGDGGVGQAISVDMGCVRYHERFLVSDPPSEEELAALVATADEFMDRVLAAIDVTAARDVVGLAGTVTTVAALALGLPLYDSERIHGARIAAADIDRIAADLARLTVAERRDLAVMHPGRADVIVSGATILAVIMRRLGMSSLIASEHDILDGLAWSLLDPQVRPRPD